ncbi:MAG: hypothetical protein GXX95_07780 [Methanomassiliicoccus sp.]|nr:hypothetical protein [Methanomassiliicoccus sp.]
MTDSIWTSPHYKIRKKILAIANQYWIEDGQGRTLGFTKQKLLRLREDIRIYADEAMVRELFWVHQEQVMDAWGTFAVVDTAANVCVGKIRRNIMSGLLADEYYLLDPYGQQIGRVYEETGRGLVRKYLPFGGLVTERVVVELYGRPVTEIKQQFKIIGDEWDVDCSKLPPQFDRRVLLAGIIMMGMVERERDRN